MSLFPMCASVCSPLWFFIGPTSFGPVVSTEVRQKLEKFSISVTLFNVGKQNWKRNSTTEQHFVVVLKYYISMRQTSYHSKLINTLAKVYIILHLALLISPFSYKSITSSPEKALKTRLEIVTLYILWNIN